MTQNNAGNWLEDTTSMVDKALKFFEAQFKEDNVPAFFFGILEHVTQMIQDGQNHDFVKQLSREEATQVVFGLLVEVHMVLIVAF